MAPLKVVIVGAGISGLTAAIALRHQGHKITLLEKSTFHQEAGAAILIGPNVSGILANYGFQFEAAGANYCLGMIRYDEKGEVQRKVDFEHISKHWKHPMWMIHRNDLHQELKRLALQPEGKAPVPELLLGCKISKVDAEAGVVELEDGKRYECDLIVGADGNRSISRSQIAPDAKLKPWGKSCYRWLTPKEALMADADTKDIFGLEGYFGEIAGDDRRMVYYPCRDNTMVNFATFVPDEESNAKGADYNQQGNKKLVEKAYTGFFAGVRKAIAVGDEDMKVWDLLDMDVIPTWNKNRLVLIGDAAHPFLPFLGQGGSMAIEDGVSIAALLPADTPASAVPERLELYQEVRHERGTRIQQGSRVNGMDADKRPKDYSFEKIFAYALNFDEWENSSQKLREKLQQNNAVNER